MEVVIQAFLELEKAVKDALNEQKSDLALLYLTRGALYLHSSDIHIEVHEGDVGVRIRRDGDLVDVFAMDMSQYKLLLERLKYKSNLKMNITNLPQDGKYRIIEGDLKIDVRVSTLPTNYGESCVCRVLDASHNIPKIEVLGLSWGAKHQVERGLKKKNGMILVTGPTGSGKTTTLYSMLQHLSSPSRKTITLEEPIEYEFAGIVQSEINEKIGYTYPVGLRTLLRQDPDIIMIGEIRDLETAQIASQSALTGHLVLSTLHTNSATETIERLLSMGMQSYILAASVDMIIAQRLVRRVCPHCMTRTPATSQERSTLLWLLKDMGLAKIESIQKEEFLLPRSHGCTECGQTGFIGRVGVYEVLTFDESIRAIVRDGAESEKILTAARQNDFLLMREDGCLRVLRGDTTLEELFAVVD